MKYLFFLSTLALVLILALSCGPETNLSPKAALEPGQKYTLMLFAAPWCSTCKHEMPNTQTLVQGRRTLSTVLVVVSGELPAVPATPEISAAYAKTLGWTLGHRPDVDLKLYRHYFPSKVQTLPSAAILNQQGELVRTLGPRFLNQNLEDLIRALP